MKDVFIFIQDSDVNDSPEEYEEDENPYELLLTAATKKHTQLDCQHKGENTGIVLMQTKTFQK